MRIELIALLIIDECHYAQKESNHPYAKIMKIFYKSSAIKLPRIFGMTASPIYGKGASVESLETLLHAKVHSVESRVELEQFVGSPQLNIYYYHATTSGSDSPHMVYYRKLEEIKNKCVSMLKIKTQDQTIPYTKKTTKIAW
jgi:endoribonuclease Dicer